MSEDHQPFIKTPTQLIKVVVLAFVVPIMIIVLLVKYVGTSTRMGAGAEAMTPEAIEARIQPVAKFVLKDESGPKTLRAGADVYTAQCAVCHGAGVAGAPKVGDAAAWAPRIKTGYDAMLTSVLKGKGAMAAQGGGEYEDIELGRAIVHMVNLSGGKLEEPKAPDAGATAAAPAAQPAMAAPAAAAPAAAAPAAAPAQGAAAAAPAAMAAAAGASAGAEKGKALYESACSACHIAGVAGAPKLGDKAAWAPRLAAGIDGLTAAVIKGKGAMPPKGGSSASDAEIRAAVEHMVATVK